MIKGHQGKDSDVLVWFFKAGNSEAKLSDAAQQLIIAAESCGPAPDLDGISFFHDAVLEIAKALANVNKENAAEYFEAVSDMISAEDQEQNEEAIIRLRTSYISLQVNFGLTIDSGMEPSDD